MFRTLLKSERGAVILLTALAMVVLCGLVGLAVDGGSLYITKAKLQNAVDAAALAGSQALYENAGLAKNIAEEYIEKNGFSKDSLTIDISEMAKSIRVEGEVDITYTFMKILGFTQGVVKASATAISGPLTSIDNGLRPLAIYDENLEYGKHYILKYGADDGETGNYGFIRLGDSGATQVAENLKNGYNGKIKKGDSIQSETGNLSSNAIRKAINDLIDDCTHGCTYDNYQEGCSRLIAVPIFDPPAPAGAGYKEVKGFAMFMLDPINITSPYGHAEITGYFIEYTTSGDIDSSQTDSGLRGVKLTE
ncbi:MAG: hypothetical protein APF76_17950 [Desulfitibacter sp. BRH_c19]|nr:MAG: hypothetical protein APF76_17950 [Desulfitibacter sp. BRH_c19]